MILVKLMPKHSGKTAAPRFSALCSALKSAMPARSSFHRAFSRQTIEGFLGADVFHLHAVVGDVALGEQVLPLDVGGVEPERPGGLLYGALDDEEALRAAEAPERGERHEVGPAHRAGGPDVGDVVRAGGVEQRARQ